MDASDGDEMVYWSELVCRAEQAEMVILTCKVCVSRTCPSSSPSTFDAQRRAYFLNYLSQKAAAKALLGAPAAQADHFLYRVDGLPG